MPAARPPGPPRGVCPLRRHAVVRRHGAHGPGRTRWARSGSRLYRIVYGYAVCGCDYGTFFRYIINLLYTKWLKKRSFPRRRCTNKTVRRTVHRTVHTVHRGQSTDDGLSTPPCNSLSKCPRHLRVLKLQPRDDSNYLAFSPSPRCSRPHESRTHDEQLVYGVRTLLVGPTSLITHP